MQLFVSNIMRRLFNTTKKIAFTAILSVSMFLCGSSVFAQSFSIRLMPQNPTPGSAVKATVSSYNFDVDLSDISWTVDGEKTEGISSEFTMPEFGETKKISVSLTTPNGDYLSKTITLQGNDIDLLYESEGYTPYWYKGLALPIIQSQVKATAIPHLFSNGSKISSSKLSYDWYLNDKIQVNSSGLGKDSFAFQAEGYNDQYLTVKVSNQDKSAVFEKSTVIPTRETKPEIIFYKKSPSLGLLFNKAFYQQMQMQENLIAITAEPFYFSNVKEQNIKYNWQMNGEDLPNSQHLRSINLKKTDTPAYGTVNMSLEIQNLKNFLQKSNNSLSINLF